MNILHLPKCLIGAHKRDPRQAWENANGVILSVCKGCGTPMYKKAGSWRVGRPDDAG